MVSKLLDELSWRENREQLSLTETEGDVIPYKDCNIPDVLEKPLRVSEEGKLHGWKSGERSVLVCYKEKWYKLKGVKPSTQEHSIPGVPRGCQKRSVAERELDASAAISDFGLENGIKAPMSPVCLFKYRASFEGEPVCASVFEVKSDYRLSHFADKFLDAAEKAYRREERNACTIRQELTSKIGNWVGFWYRALEQHNLCWGTTNNENSGEVHTNVGNHNLVAYRVGGGVGIGIVDLDRKETPNETTKKTELDIIRKRLSIFDGALYFLGNGRSAKSIRAYYYFQIFASMGLQIYGDGFDPFHGVQLPDEDALGIIEHFDEGRKGKIPQPINAKFFTNTEDIFLHKRYSTQRSPS